MAGIGGRLGFFGICLYVRKSLYEILLVLRLLQMICLYV